MAYPSSGGLKAQGEEWGVGRPIKGPPSPSDKAPASTGGGAAQPARNGVKNGGQRSFRKVTVKTPARRGAQTLGAYRRRCPEEAK